MKNKISNILLILIIVLNFSCLNNSNKKKTQKLKDIETVNKVDSISDNTISFNEYDKTGQVLFERISDTEIWIYNCLYSGFTGETTLIKVKKNLKVKSAYYHYSTDVIDGNSTEFKVTNSEISFDKNPFNSNEEIDINYELKINEISYSTKELINSKTLNPRIKSRKMNSENINKYKKKYGFINSFNAYRAKYLDKKPELLSSIETFKRKLNSDFKINRIMILFSTDTKGKILKESIKLIVPKKLTAEQKNRIEEIITKYLKYSPGYINEKPVRTELILRI